MGAPILFWQQRPGLNAKVFLLLKFRTMTDKKNEKGGLLPNLERITRLGKLLRENSIDELPELFNILKGEMSFVGPRPLLVKYLSYYTEKENKRHLVRPGLTGMAQVKGRNALSWEDRFAYDLWYVDHVSFKLDIKILFMTILPVVKRQGINSGSIQIVEPYDEYLLKKSKQPYPKLLNDK